LSAIEVHKKNAGHMNDFAKISKFSCNLFLSLISIDEEFRLNNFHECLQYLNDNIEFINAAVFYCVYNDIARIRRERPSIFGESFGPEPQGGDYREKFNDLFDQLYFKHSYFQKIEINRQLMQFPPTNNHIQAIVCLNKGDSYSGVAREVIERYEDVTITRNDVYKCKNNIISNEKMAIKKLKSSIDVLLDHASIIVSSPNFQVVDNQSLNLEGVMPFTAILDNEMRKAYFQEYFWVNGECENDNKSIVLSKKIMSFDSSRGTKRVFINPTIGCNINCSYCYLPDYSISHKKCINHVLLSGKQFS
jgi:hypothetical protein